MNDAPTEPRVLSPWEYYLLFRNRIEHEDNLIMQRLSWLVASQSFLFTAQAITLSGLLSVPPNASSSLVELEKLLLHLIPAVAILTSGLIYVGIIAAVKAIRTLRDSYQSRFGNEQASLPGIMTNDRIRIFGLAAPVLLPLIFIVVWLVLWTSGMR